MGGIKSTTVYTCFVCVAGSRDQRQGCCSTTPTHVEHGWLLSLVNFANTHAHSYARLSQPKGAGKATQGGRVKIPHPNSRKAAQMTKKFLRLQKIDR